MKDEKKDAKLRMKNSNPAYDKGGGKGKVGKFQGKPMTGRGGVRKGGGRGFTAREAAAILGKAC